MDDSHRQYMRCPYCGKDGGHKKTVSKTVGWFRIQQIYTNVLILKCKKCSKVFRIQMVGKPLLWADMSAEEKKIAKGTFKTNYAKTKLKEDKK